jgi:hypothetical protein
MAEPRGEVVARPMVARACGCLCEFQHYSIDKYRTERLAKFQKSRCPTCVAKLNEQQKQAAAAMPSKGEALRLLPPGSNMTLVCKSPGVWEGTLVASGATLKAVADSPQGLTVALARQWVSTKGPKPKPV